MTDVPSELQPSSAAGAEQIAQIPLIRGSDYRVLYANALRMRVTQIDIGVSFGFADEMPGGAKLQIENAMVIMVPAVAKQLAIALGEAVKAFESAYGAISIAPGAPIDPAALMSAVINARKAAGSGET